MSEIVFNSSKPQDLPEADLRSQIENLQTTLASLNQQVIILQEALQEKDQQITELESKPRQNNTLSIAGLLIKLYKFIFMPGKDNSY